MAKTASERQAAYRAKPDQYRLSLYINGEARAALTALARHRGCSQREVIESLIVAEKNALVSAMDIDDLARFYEQVTR
jgi:Mg/Co/Ni transporter MgtE